MATAFPRATGQAAPDQYADPYAALIAAARAKMNTPAPGLYSEAEQAARRAENDRQYQLGMLGQLSGDETLAGVGGQILKQALAARQQRVNERGTADPITGKFTYDPEFLRQRQEQDLGQLETRSAQARGAYSEQRMRAEERREAAEDRAVLARSLQAMRSANAPSNEPLVGVIDPSTGQAIYIRRSQAVGMTPASGGNATEDERKAAGWLQQAQSAFADMKSAVAKEPTSAQPSITELVTGAIPKVGPTLQYATMTPERQRFTGAASSFSEAVLRAATGAGVNESEAKQKVNELTPRWGESPSVTADKERRAEMYISSLTARAGRAAPRAGGAGVPRPGATPTAAAAPTAGAAPANASGLSPEEAAELANLRKRFGK